MIDSTAIKKLERDARTARKLYHSGVPIESVRKMIDVKSLRYLKKLLMYKSGSWNEYTSLQECERALSYVLHLLDEAEDTISLLKR